MLTTRRPGWWIFALVWLISPGSAGGADSLGNSRQVITIYPITTGISRAPATPISRIVVLSPQTGPSPTAALAAGKDVFRRGGITVIEHPAFSPSRATQGPQRPDRPHDDDPSFLTFGKRASADHVIVIEVTDTLVLEERGPLKNTYLHDERVSVRGIDVTTGTVVLEGTARWSQPIERAGEHMRELTTYAIARAICAPEKWVEASAANHGRGRCQR